MAIQLRNFAANVVGAGCLLGALACEPAAAQQATPKADDRVELIMEGLPVAGSPEYKALLRQAGDMP